MLTACICKVVFGTIGVVVVISLIVYVCSRSRMDRRKAREYRY